ncbi:hypothetical protein H4R33_005224 [Dimargaris cristalligena]|nr:hypothetical protein H4R33_005224 [Dimargaris cristalligena]
MYESSIPANRVPSFFETIFSYPDALRVRGSIILTILPNVLSVTLFATAVAVANDRLSSRIGLPNTLVGSFSVVLGLLLVFRSNTAHDSFKEGRRVWSQLKTAVRNITRIVWLGVPAKTPEEIQEKAQMIRYLVAYVVATKHYLRGENGIDYEDLEDLIPEEFRRHYLESGACTGRHEGPSTPEAIIEVAAGTSSISPFINTHPHAVGETSTRRDSTTYFDSPLDQATRAGTPGSPATSAPGDFRRFNRVGLRKFSGRPRKFTSQSDEIGTSRHSRRYYSEHSNEETRLLLDSTAMIPQYNLIATAHSLALPAQILFRINRYVFRQRQANNIDPQTGNILNTTLANMHDSFTNLERILLTPIPLAYRVHLKQSLYLYCFLLPFTLIDLHYLMIPLVTAVAFMLFGIDGIGREIENPFGYDLNDLPLDRICEDLREEIEYVINTYPPGDMPASSG